MINPSSFLGEKEELIGKDISQQKLCMIWHQSPVDQAGLRAEGAARSHVFHCVREQQLEDPVEVVLESSGVCRCCP